MATEHILSLLISERDRLNKAIEALGGSTRHLGRPSKSFEAAAATHKGRRTFTAAQKKQQSERMKAYWAARRKKKA
jgi:D-Tyr-tRNAtyr deacylase